MAVAKVQTAKNTVAYDVQQTVTFGSSTTSGNLIGLHILTPGAPNAGLTVTDNKGNTYINAISNHNTTNAGYQLWYAKNISGGASHTITVAYTGSQGVGLEAIEISGCDTSSPLGPTANNTYNSSSVTSLATGTTAATTIADAIAISAISINTAPAQTWTSTGSWTISDSISGAAQNVNGAQSYKIFSATQSSVSDTWGWTTSVSDIAIGVAVFYGASAGFDPATVPWQTDTPIAPGLAVVGY